jgi:undecaprenyl diphosphate synthase
MPLAEMLAAVPPDSREQALVRQVDFDRLPRHVAIIMDGNGRWAEARRLPRVEGHRAGTEAVRDTVETSARMGISVPDALRVLGGELEAARHGDQRADGLLKHYLRAELKTLLRNNIRFRVIGQVERLSKDILVSCAPQKSARPANTGMLFNIALSYGGRAEIVDAARRAIRAGTDPDGSMRRPSRHFSTPAGQPDPDLLIRTSGEMRVSNFLLWQIAYAEIWVTDALWPDFRARHLLEGICEYQKRDRRYGAIHSQAVGVKA